jgi:hypothetical protein
LWETFTLQLASGRQSLGFVIQNWDYRGGADRGAGGDSENHIADHGSLFWFLWDVLSHPGCQSDERSVGFERRAEKRFVVMAITR